MKTINILFLFVCCISVALAESFTWQPNKQKQVKPLELEQYSSDPLSRALKERERERERERQLIGEFIKIPAGSFRMGDLFGDGLSHEKPVHEVKINSFELGKYEVTQSQWQAVMGSNPSVYKGCQNCPVDQVSWDDIHDYLRKLNQMTGIRYRLPTEAEWEYACRSGGKKERYCGGGNRDALAWHNGNSRNKTHPVGQKQPNGLGLYDMSGNVWEWVQDCYSDSYSGAPRDGTAWRDGDCSRVVLRGGSWNYKPGSVRSASRYWNYRYYRSISYGFRLARDP